MVCAWFRLPGLDGGDTNPSEGYVEEADPDRDLSSKLFCPEDWCGPVLDGLASNLKCFGGNFVTVYPSAMFRSKVRPLYGDSRSTRSVHEVRCDLLKALFLDECCVRGLFASNLEGWFLDPARKFLFYD